MRQSRAAAGRCEFAQALCESTNNEEVVFVLKDIGATVHRLVIVFKLNILTIEAAGRKHLKQAYCRSEERHVSVNNSSPPTEQAPFSAARPGPADGSSACS